MLRCQLIGGVDVWEFWLEENDGELPQMMGTAGMAH